MQLGITYQQEHCGTAEILPEGLYQTIRCHCQMVSGEVLRCYAVVGEKTMCLGVMAPEGGQLVLEKKMSSRQWAPWQDGRLELAREPPVIQDNPWKPWQGRLYGHDVAIALACTQAGETEIALPYSMEEPFPYMELFCKLTPKNIGGKMYLTCMLP